MKEYLLAAGLVALSGAAFAHDIESAVDPAKPAPFDITAASATTDGRLVTFAMELAGEAGSIKPEATGKLPGARVAAYVWPTGLDPAIVGFAPCAAASGVSFGYTSMSFTTQSLSVPVVAANNSTSGAPMMCTGLSSGADFHEATSGRSDTKR